MRTVAILTTSKVVDKKTGKEILCPFADKTRAFIARACNANCAAFCFADETERYLCGRGGLFLIGLKDVAGGAGG